MRNKTTAQTPPRSGNAPQDTRTTRGFQLALWDESDEEFMRVVKELVAETGGYATDDSPCAMHAPADSGQ
jgi:hypothetical protein